MAKRTLKVPQKDIEMGLLARRSLSHNKVRLTVTLTGIVFALMLIVVQFGLFLGFTTTTSKNIDHSGVDAWVVSHGVRFFDTGKPFSERKYFQVLGTPGVAREVRFFVPRIHPGRERRDCGPASPARAGRNAKPGRPFAQEDS